MGLLLDLASLFQHKSQPPRLVVDQPGQGEHGVVAGGDGSHPTFIEFTTAVSQPLICRPTATTKRCPGDELRRPLSWRHPSQHLLNERIIQAE